MLGHKWASVTLTPWIRATEREENKIQICKTNIYLRAFLFRQSKDTTHSNKRLQFTSDHVAQILNVWLIDFHFQILKGSLTCLSVSPPLRPQNRFCSTSCSACLCLSLSLSLTCILGLRVFHLWPRCVLHKKQTLKASDQGLTTTLCQRWWRPVAAWDLLQSTWTGCRAAPCHVKHTAGSTQHRTSFSQ